MDWSRVVDQLFGLSFWRHPFTAEDPLESDAKFIQIIQMKRQTDPHLGWPEGKYIFSKFSILDEILI